MKYTEFIIHTNAEGIDIVTATLWEKGIEKTHIEDPRDIDDLISQKKEMHWDYISEDLLEKSNKESRVIIYLEEDQDKEKIKEVIEELRKNVTMNLGSLRLEETKIDDSEWKDSYKEHFKTMELTKSIIVKPTWEEEKIVGKKVIELDPGMAFGTGTHETTSMCANLLEEFSCKGKKVLDVGTGSGILAIAAHLLGAKDVLGVDIDHVAVNVAKDNVCKNLCEDTVNIVYGDLTKGINYKGDIIIANLVAELVVTLTAHIKEHMEKGGIYITSGILNEKKDIVKKAIVDSGLKLVKIVDKGEWSAIVAKNE